MEINDTPEEYFMYVIDKTIESGEVRTLIEAIKIYRNVISDEYIKMANRILMELLEEGLESINP